MTALIAKIILMVALGLGTPTATIGTVDGHQKCTAILGDTSLLVCPDGFITTS